MKKRQPIRLLFPQLQNRLLLLVLLSAGVSVVMAVCLSTYRMSQLAQSLPNDGDLVAGSIRSAMLGDMGLALALSIPLFSLLTYLVSMPFFGAMYRMHAFLTQTASREQSEPCVLREGDPMQDVCSLLNQVTEERRAAGNPPGKQAA